MNTIRFRILSVIMCTILLGFAVACKEDEPPLPDNVVSFNASELGFSDEESEATITLNISRALNEDSEIAVSFVPTGVTYGVEFTTIPVALSNAFNVTIPAGSTSATFTVAKATGIFLEGDESILFTIESADDALVLSDEVTLNLSFSQIVSDGGAMQLQGLIAAEAGSSAGNSVFVDFSANIQTPIARTSWDLGFYSGDDFRVILNSTKGSSTVMVNETNLANVTSDDINAEDLAVGGGIGSFDVYDGISGELEYTAIDEISAIASENKVYVINRVGGSGATPAVEQLMKVRITRDGTTGYTVQYALINETTTFQTINIAKNAATNFSYLHFENAAVTVEPVKTNWDIQWSWSLFWTSLGGPPVPYSFSDLVFLNHHNGVKADTVFTADVSYDDFDESDISNYDLVSERNVIGSGWRVTAPGGPEPIGVRTDRFYIVEDSQGNVYKLKFVNFHANDGGTRGKPNIQYALVKKGAN